MPVQLEPALPLFLAFAGAYLLGSIPFGLILTRLAGSGDIRTLGSGNIGATNVLRTGRKGLAIATLAGDMFKGTVAVFVAAWVLGEDASLAAAFAAVLGHVFPIWLRFKGGKGVATYIGVLIAISWAHAVAFAAIWLAVAALTRYSSVSGLTASALTPALLWFSSGTRSALVFALLTVLIFYAHRGNIRRLVTGTESKIGGSRLEAHDIQR